MKKLFLILTTIISSFFFVSNVYGVTYYSYANILDSYTGISFSVYDMISDAESFALSVNKPYYLLRYRNQKYTLFLSDSIPDIKMEFNYPSCGVLLYNYSSLDFYNYDTTNNSFTFSQTYVSGNVFSMSTVNNFADNTCSYNYSYIYSNFNVYRNRSDVNIIFTLESQTYMTIDSDSTPIPSLIDMYGTPPEPPEPPDSFPLLTDFYTLVVDKLVDICDLFSSSYLFLSIFVIFIFYFVILLLRRLL